MKILFFKKGLYFLDTYMNTFDLFKGDVRINSSRLEIYYDDGIWGTVCEDYFDDKGATVACRQLGYK